MQLQNLKTDMIVKIGSVFACQKIVRNGTKNLIR
jgi:hypothetical protein